MWWLWECPAVEARSMTLLVDAVPYDAGYFLLVPVPVNCMLGDGWQQWHLPCHQLMCYPHFISDLVNIAKVQGFHVAYSIKMLMACLWPTAGCFSPVTFNFILWEGGGGRIETNSAPPCQSLEVPPAPVNANHNVDLYVITELVVAHASSCLRMFGTNVPAATIWGATCTCLCSGW